MKQKVETAIELINNQQGVESEPENEQNQQIEVGGFFPDDVWTNKHAKKQRKKMNKKLPTSKKPRTLLKCLSIVLAGGLIGYLAYNKMLANEYNGTLPSGSPHTAEDVFDANGNDFSFGDDSQIITDTITDAEIKVLTESFFGNIEEDAISRCETEVGQIDKLISFSLIPCNMLEGSNEYDKYLLSILFENEEGNLFELHYLTGADFESGAEASKDYFADFINYLYSDCSILSCENITDNLAFFDGCFDDNVEAVGNAFWGYKESGDECYFIPVYNANGEGTVYCTICSTVDRYDKSAIEELKKYQLKLKDDNSDKIEFSDMQFVKSANIQKAMNILREKLLKTEETNLEN